MTPGLKPVHWIGDSLLRLRRFPKEARDEAGYELELVQRGDEPRDCKPMPIVGPGVMEIRVHKPHEYRVFYVARFEEAVYVLHSFVKKTRQTSQADIELARRRYRQLKEEWRVANH